MGGIGLPAWTLAYSETSQYGSVSAEDSQVFRLDNHLRLRWGMKGALEFFSA
jgi:hypothetical protein